MGSFRFAVMEFFPYQHDIKSKALSTPPASPVDGDRYIVAANATDDWAGHENEIAWYLSGTWYFDPPAKGWVAYVIDEEKRFYYNGTDWSEYIITSGEKGQPNGLATLDPSGKVPLNQLPDSVTSGLHYMGTHNASTGNYPSSNPNPGEYWIINVAGIIDGVDYQMGDWIVYNGSTESWDKIDNSDRVSSVNGKTGNVELDTDDVPEGTTNLYYTDARVSANPDVAANTAARLHYVSSLKMAVADL